MPAKLFQDVNGKWRYRVVGKNGEKMCSSEPYSSKWNARRGYNDLVEEVKGAVKIEVDRGPPQFGIADMAKELGLDVLTTRVKLRKARVPKVGRRFGWRTRKELKAAAAQLKEV